jgi:hypothetical protein
VRKEWLGGKKGEDERLKKRVAGVDPWYFHHRPANLYEELKA